MFSVTNFPDLHATLKKDSSGPHSKAAVSALTFKPAERLSSSSATSEEGYPAIGGVLKDGQHSWLARGSIFVVLASQTNSLQSIFNFSRVFPNLQYTVTTCTSCENFLLVGLNGADGRGLVAVYNPRISKLIKAIDIPYPVTALELVSSQGGAVTSSQGLSKNLRWLFGIVAVGTEEGHLYLLDLRFDSKNDNMGSLPSQIEIVPPVLRDVPKTREAIIEEQAYMAYELQAACHEEGVFHFAMPDDEIIESFYPSDTNITTLLYEPRVASLFVGFSFGQFQIFSLQDMSLYFSSEMQENLAPVLKFSFQEPENDPRNFCYLWVARGRNSDAKSTERSSDPLTLSMFQLVFMKKEVLPNSKHEEGRARVLYKNFEICSPRFEHSLGSGLVSDISQCCGSTLMLCSSLEKYASELEHHEPSADDYLSPASSLCVFAWQSPIFHGERREKLNMILFDINRWYMAHMPSNFRDDNEDYIFSAFWTFHDSNDSFNDDEEILGMHVPKSKMQHFMSGMKPHPERFVLPSACSFICNFITDQSFYQYSMFGHQQQVLNSAAEQKSMCLVNPKEMHLSMLASELFPKHNVKQVCTTDMMRENILTTALEHGQISFLLLVVRDLASGHLAACGVTLRFVMDWAWKSVANVKDSIDKLSVPIFDCSCALLDSLVQSQLYFHMTQIHHLKVIFQKLMEYTDDASEQSKEEMKTKLTVVTLIYQYLKVVQWFIRNGLLPEQIDNEEGDNDIMTQEGILIYKYSSHRQVFDQWRTENNRSGAPDLLLIDGWVEEIGEPLTSRWLKEEGGKSTYPPPSFMTLLDMYYIDCVDVTTKHCLVMYLLLDVLAMFSTLEDEGKQLVYESQKDRLNSIGLFLHTFSAPVGLIKLTQGFWLLDHKNFEESLNMFLDADTSQPTCSWQERRILRSFLHQGHPTMALKYISTRRPRIETIDDAKMHITIYIKCREPLKAWDLVQLSSGHHNMNELFLHLFTSCQQNSQLDQLLKLPFSPVEENMVIKYLRESNSAEATQILVLFYLQHSRYVDAIKLHSQSKHIRIMQRDQSDEARRHNAKLDHIVQSYTNLLPSIEREITFSSHKLFKQSAAVRRELHKPSSISAVVRSQKSNLPLSHADRLTRYMDKMDESRKNVNVAPMTPFRKKQQPSILGDYPMIADGYGADKKSSTINLEDKFVYPSVPVSSRKSFPANGLFRRRSSFGGSPARGFADSSELPKPAHTHAAMSRIGHGHAKDRRYSSISVASMLLQTPPISRKRRSVSRGQQEGSLEMMTPHSILKVKKLFNRNQSPSLSAISQNFSLSNSPIVRRAATADSNVSLASESITSGDSDNIRICDGGLESEDDIPDWLKWQKQRNRESRKFIKKLHSTSLDSEGFNQTPLKFQENDDEMPTISTPSVNVLKKQGLRKFDSTINIAEQENLPYTTPKKLRFAGLDSSANDSLVAQTSPVEQVQGLPNLTPVVVKAEDSHNEDEMDVDVTGGGSVDYDGRGSLEDVVEIPAQDDKSLEELQEEEGSQDDSGGLEEDQDLIIENESFESRDEFEEQLEQEIEEGEDGKENPHEEDEVICLDTSSEEEVILSEDQNKEEEVAQETDAPSRPPPGDESLRLVLSSSEESLGFGEHLEEHGGDSVQDDEKKSTDASNDEEDKIAALTEDVSSPIEQEELQSIKEVPEIYEETLEEQGESSDQIHLHLDSNEEDVFENDIVEDDELISPELFVPHLSIPPPDEEDIIGDVVGMNPDGDDVLDVDVHPDIISQEVTETEAIILKIPEEESEVLGGSDQVEMEALQLSTDVEELSEEVSAQEEKQISSEGAPKILETSKPMTEEDHQRSPVEVQEREISENIEQEAVVELPKQEELITKQEVEEEKPEIALEEELVPEYVKEEEQSMQIQEEIKSSVKIHATESSIETVDKTEPNKEDLDIKNDVEKPSAALPAIILTEEKPSTPVIDRVRSQPTFVLSPPTTRRSSRKSSKTVQGSPKAKTASEMKVPKSPSRITRSASKQIKDPEFLFSPPTTRTRSTRKKNKTINESDQSLAASPPLTTKINRNSLQVPVEGRDTSTLTTSPVRVSKATRTRKASSSEEKKELSPSTPSRKTRQSPGRKAPSTPTRSSSRVRAKLNMTKESEKASESELLEEPPVPKRSRRKSKTTASDVASSGTDSEVASSPVRKRYSRSKSKSSSATWSPSQDQTRLIELTPLPEEEEEEDEVTMKKRKKEEKKKKAPTTRATRSSTSNPVRMRRKAKVFTLPE